MGKKDVFRIRYKARKLKEENPKSSMITIVFMHSIVLLLHRNIAGVII